ncbi:MAG: hypothetical protein HQL75_08445 [Magnetococcales bacterium]|nr:hypothetical protein [Magnetococcales bacterium]
MTTTPLPPPHVTAHSDDNRVGFMFVLGVLILYGVWQIFGGEFAGLRGGVALVLSVPGILFLLLAVRRLFRPGCKMILRINHGGVTDFRLGNQPVLWEEIIGVERTQGWVGWVLPAVVLKRHPAQPFGQDATLWCKVLHTALSFLYPGSVVILCATLDVSCHDIHRVMVQHHRWTRSS